MGRGQREPAGSATTSGATIRPRGRINDFGAEVRRRASEGLAVRHTATYEVRGKLKELGCIWARNERAWLAPDAETLTEAMELCNSYSPPGLAEQVAALGRDFIGETSATRELHGRHSIGDIIEFGEHNPFDRFGDAGAERRFVVESVGSGYYHSEDDCEDHDCFCGHYGMRYTTQLREVSLTDDERQVVEQREQRRAGRQRVGVLFTDIERDGEWPEGDHLPAGDQFFGSRSIYGGGTWIVVGDGSDDQPWIWAVSNNGGDGDNWGRNNVRTGGAGAIGHRVPWTAELDAELRELAAIVDDDS